MGAPEAFTATTEVGHHIGGRTIASMVYGVHASDPIVLLSATVVVAVITCAATALPAKRAAHTDPILALRGD